MRSTFFIPLSYTICTKLVFTCFPICLRIHDNKLWTQLAYPSAFEDRHQSTQVLKVQSVTGAPNFRVILRPLHGTVETLVSNIWVAHKITHVVGIWDRRLKRLNRVYNVASQQLKE